MYPDPGVDALLFEVEERRRQATMHRLARLCTQSQVRPAGRARFAVGSAIVRLGALVSGDDALRSSWSEGAGTWTRGEEP